MNNDLLKKGIAIAITVLTYFGIIFLATSNINPKTSGGNDLFALVFAVFGVPPLQFLIGWFLKQTDYPDYGKGVIIGVITEVIIGLLTVIFFFSSIS